MHFFRDNYILIIIIICFIYSLIGCDTCNECYYNHDIYVSDTIIFKDHSYISFRDSFNNMVVLHSPDCFCRYNRKFIVIKRNK